MEAGNPHPDVCGRLGYPWGGPSSVCGYVTHRSAGSLKVNRAKSELTPTQQAHFLGLSLDTIANIIRLSVRWLSTVQARLAHVRLGACVSYH